jgi:HK97 family phage prohead protease
MPWTVRKTDECPTSRPWGVIRDSDGTVEGCHMTQAAANRQRAALYASETRGASMRHKTFQLVETKADEKGTFTALASVFGNVDMVGDRMMKGAFRKTLDAWRESGDPIPVILSHQWDDPMAHIGKADPRAVMETDEGLVVQGQIDMDNPIARQVHKLMAERRLKGWSFGYTVAKDGEKRAEDGANEVYEVDLIEVGPTLRGANSQAELQTIKSALRELPDEDPQEASPQDEIEDESDEEPVAAKSRSQDPLRTESRRMVLDVLSDGASARKYEPEIAEPAPEPPSEDELRRRFCDLII